MFKHLFSPISIGALELRNRIIMPAMATNLADLGRVSQRLIDFYLARAHGGVAAIMALSVPVFMQDELDSFKELYGVEMPSIFVDEYLNELKKLSTSIKSAGARVGIQLVHLGNQGIPGLTGSGLVAPSAISSLIAKEPPHELSVTEINHLVDQFVRASQRSKEAGFDIVELHGAHGYLISEFLSRFFNRREDIYGGGPENMARFPGEIISKVKQELGDSIVIGIRINGDDNIPGGTTIDDAAEMAVYLEKSGADYLSISGGVYGSAKATVPPMMEACGCYVSLASAIKKVVKIPVITAGRINTPELAEEILERNHADIIGMARPLIADPDLPAKARSGDLSNLRKCIACNQGCIDQINKTILPGKDDGQDASLTCLVNPVAGKENILKLKPAITKKRVLVVGGGPAGMEAAKVAARRGHEVILIEKSTRLGGQLNLAAVVPNRQEMKEEIRYLTSQLKRFGVQVIMGKAVNKTVVEEHNPDTVIVATGSLPRVPSIEKSDIRTITAWEVLGGQAIPEKKILIVGGGSVGLETALFIADKNKQVIIIEQFKWFGADMGPISRFYLRSKLNEYDVTMKKQTRFIAMKNNDAVVMEGEEEKLIPDIELIIWSVGAIPENSLVEEIGESDYEILTIGDAAGPGNALTAIGSAHKTALQI